MPKFDRLNFGRYGKVEQKKSLLGKARRADGLQVMGEVKQELAEV